MPASRSVAAFELDGVALAVVEAERFDPRKALQRPGQAGRGILPAGKQHQRGFGSKLSFDRSWRCAIALIDRLANRWK